MATLYVGSASVSQAYMAGATVVPQNTAAPVAPSTNFSVSNGRIYDPSGAEFIPVGTNANGPDFVWQGPTIGSSTPAQKWPFNAIRINMGLANSFTTSYISTWAGGVENGGGYDFHNNDDLASIVSEYTAKGIVCIISNHQINPGSYGDNDPRSGSGTSGSNSTINTTKINAIRDRWVQIANQFKSNPYVWFNLLNEPGVGGSSVLPQWKSVHDTIATGIRGTGATNVIVMDACQYGQDTNSFDISTPDLTQSAIYTHGQYMQSTYGPVVFSLHVYGAWGAPSTTSPTNTQLDTRMNYYIDQIESKNLPLIIGETGHPYTGGDWNAGETAGTNTIFRVLAARASSGKIKHGILLWHGDANSSYQLCGSGGSGQHWSQINSSSSPTNLTTVGQQLWTYIRSTVGLTPSA